MSVRPNDSARYFWTSVINIYVAFMVWSMFCPFWPTTAPRGYGKPNYSISGTPIVTARQGKEPVTFTGFFAGWDDEFWDTDINDKLAADYAAI